MTDTAAAAPSSPMLDLVRTLTDEEWNHLAGTLLTVHFPTARDDQRRPSGDWRVWLILAGRGWGKTRTGAEDLVEQCVADPGVYFLAAPTFRDMRNVNVEGDRSGVLAVLDRRCIPYTWNLSNTEIALGNGSRIIAGSADEPDRWRGYNFKGGWCDEVATWRRPDTFTQIRLATRMGESRIVVTTTPKPTSLVRSLVEMAGGPDPTVYITRGSTWDNAENLSEAALSELRRRYEGTRIGRQELEGELLLDTPGALWTVGMLDAGRVDEAPSSMVRVVTAIDPAVTSGEDSDFTGLVTVGLGHDGDLYVLADRTTKDTPLGWARRAVQMHDDFEGDRIVGEVNNGGDLVETTLRQVEPTVPFRAVRASRGKRVRAEPVAALYEQGRVHHVRTADLTSLEDQLVSWTPDSGGSPDRLDALVWACTDLTEPAGGRRGIVRAA